MESDDRPTIGFAVPAALVALTVRFDLHAEIGRGGMGVVYRALDRQTNDLVAIKVIHPSIASDPSVIERFRNELILARRITHKNVCRVHDLNEFGGLAVISMELVAGRSLRDILREVDSMSTRHGLRIVRQVIAGLSEAHAQGVVHRDLKPENILVGRDGAVKILDFGIARLADSSNTLTGVVIGTPAYMSPEQIAGKPADVRSDIYSLGLVMYEMFCGQPAFSGETPVAIVAKQLHEAPPPPRDIEPDLPVRIAAAILTCLHKKPERRFQTVGELEAALMTTAAPVGGSHVVELPVRLTRWQTMDWFLLAGAALGLALFLPLFARISLAPRSQVTFDRTGLRRIASEHLQRLGAPETPVTQIEPTLDPSAYIYLAKRHGAAAAREAANNPIRYWTYQAGFTGAAVDVDHRGRLVSFSRTPVPLDSGAISLDDARRRALQAIEDTFEQPASALEKERESQGAQYSFTWLGPKTTLGLRSRYDVDVDKAGVSRLDVGHELPPDYRGDWFDEITMDRWGLPVAVIFCLLAAVLGLVNRARVAPAAPWRIAVAGISFVGGAGFSFSSLPSNNFGVAVSAAVAISLGLLYAVVSFLGSIAVEMLAHKSRPYKLGTLERLFKRPVGKSESGLSIVRGAAIGLAILGADTLIIWLGITYLGARLSPIHVGLIGGVLTSVAWPIGVILVIGAVQMVGIGLLVAFADSVAARLQSRQWIGVVGAAVLLGASGIRTSMGAVQPWYWTLLVLLGDYLLLVITYRLFDLLTLFAAIGTFAVWWATYPLFIMQQPIGADGPWTAFVIWGLAVAGAATLAFWSALGHVYRRAAGAFE